jgi:hypothetical protein
MRIKLGNKKEAHLPSALTYCTAAYRNEDSHLARRKESTKLAYKRCLLTHYLLNR